MNPNPKMKAAIKEAEEAKTRIAETINPKTAAQIELLLSIKDKVEKSQTEGQADGKLYIVKLTSDEAAQLWAVCKNLVYQYENGTDHVCEYDKTTFNCIVCGESL